jgi:hypothetical protein
MIHLDPLDQQRLQRGVEHLHGLGARATAEALAEIVHRIGGFPTVLAVLGEFSTISRRQLQAAGGDRFPLRPVRRLP